MKRHRARFVSLGAIAALVSWGSAFAAEVAPSKPSVMPFVASVARVRIDVSRQRAAVLHEINLARGTFAGDEDVELFVAFGAPGAPRAIDTRLVTVPRAMLEAPREERGVPLVWRYAPRRPTSAAPIVGRGTMAGIAVVVPAELMAKTFASGATAALRVRAVYNLSEMGERDVVVRLGDGADGPLTLGRLEVATTDDAPVRVEARACSDTSLPPLLLRTFGRAIASRDGALAPVLWPRKAGDDLCVRLVRPEGAQ